MARTNYEVASAFDELADLMQISGADRFRTLAYRRAADALRGLARDVGALSDQDLIRVRGIGKTILAKVRELGETGTMGVLEDLRAAYPAGAVEMARLPGLGPKRAVLLARELGVTTLEELGEAIRAGRLRGIKGMGAKTEENLLRTLATYAGERERIFLARALKVAEEMLDGLRAVPGVVRASYAGSLRRMRETIGDIDLLAASQGPEAVMDAFAKLPNVDRVLARGPTKATVLTGGGLQVDLRVVAPDEYGSALQYFTGSQAHNIKVREHAVRMGLKLSEYGLFRVKGVGGDEPDRIASRTEEEVYGALGMQVPPPTMREDRGEVELALRGELPTPVEPEDLLGDLQAHSTYSDGKVSLRRMALAAASRGHRYFAITDHGRNLHLRSLSIEDIARQGREVKEINESLAGRMELLHGVELNIGPEGELDYPDEVLTRFDVVVASVHHQLGMDRAGMTRRILRAIENPHVHILGHPTGRILGRRPASELDLEAVCEAAAAHGVALEINASPRRLDLKDDHIFLAREYGCLFAISTDAHSPAELDYLRFGICSAQRGWVTRREVINALPLEELRRFLAKETVGRR
ncbi:MAG: DNA polymerase/3'-5' exonuclease PolX [Actinomycetota bacterium]